MRLPCNFNNILGLWLVFIVFMFSSTVYAYPKRIASINLCTDQLLFEIAAPNKIISTTYLSLDPEISNHPKRAKKYRVNHGLAEEIVHLNPDLILAGKYSSLSATKILRKLGFEVAEFEPAVSIDGIYKNIERLSNLIGRPNIGRKLIQKIKHKFNPNNMENHAKKPTAVIFKARGFTLGKNSLANEVVLHSGLINIAQDQIRGSFDYMPLEQLIALNPDLIITDAFNENSPSLSQNLLKHPALGKITQIGSRENDPNVAVIPARYWNCGNSFITHALAQLKNWQIKVNK